MDFFLEVFRKFEKTLRAPVNKCLIFIVHTAILNGSSHKQFNYKALAFRKKWGNTPVVLSFVCPTNELKDYSDKPVKQNLFKDCKRAKSFGD